MWKWHIKLLLGHGLPRKLAFPSLVDEMNGCFPSLPAVESCPRQLLHSPACLVVRCLLSHLPFPLSLVESLLIVTLGVIILEMMKPGVMAQWLRALAVLPENQSSSPAFTWHSQPSVIPVPGNLIPSVTL